MSELSGCNGWLLYAGMKLDDSLARIRALISTQVELDSLKAEAAFCAQGLEGPTDDSTQPPTAATIDESTLFVLSEQKVCLARQVTQLQQKLSSSQ